MSRPLPDFTYHPDPLGTGAIEARPIRCACCGDVQPYVYVGPVYGDRDLDEQLCPWCIADGSAASKLGATFAADRSLCKAGVPGTVVAEVNQRTPAFTSWQQEEWLAHCNDACEFHGDASVEDVHNASERTRQGWRERYGLSEEDWSIATRNYVPAGHQAFYKFRCRHCRAILLGWDCA
jgi:uncharacterized protein CbrC (UPF0167 family)